MADPEVRARKSAAMKLAMADPEVRARHAAAMADPEVRARQEKNAGWLSAAERASVVASLRAGASYDDVAADWLLSYGRVCQIAKEEGLQRRPRRKGVNAAAVTA